MQERGSLCENVNVQVVLEFREGHNYKIDQFFKTHASKVLQDTNHITYNSRSVCVFVCLFYFYVFMNRWMECDEKLLVEVLVLEGKNNHSLQRLGFGSYRNSLHVSVNHIVPPGGSRYNKS